MKDLSTFNQKIAAKDKQSNVSIPLKKYIFLLVKRKLATHLIVIPCSMRFHTHAFINALLHGAIMGSRSIESVFLQSQ